jgi:hypothetical protein
VGAGRPDVWDFHPADERPQGRHALHDVLHRWVLSHFFPIGVEWASWRRWSGSAVMGSTTDLVLWVVAGRHEEGFGPVGSSGP